MSVRDSGDWREPRGEDRGRGIPVMKEFMDDVSDRRGRRRDHRGAAQTDRERGLMPELAKLSVESDGDIELGPGGRGRSMHRTSAELSRRLLDAVSNRARALVLDLTETSYIDSSGISLIFDAAARMRNRRQQLRLVVRPRSFVGEVARRRLDRGLGPDRSGTGRCAEGDRRPVSRSALDDAERVAADLQLVPVAERAPVDLLHHSRGCRSSSGHPELGAHPRASARSPRAGARPWGRRAGCPPSGSGRFATTRRRARSRSSGRRRTSPGTCPGRRSTPAPRRATRRASRRAG